LIKVKLSFWEILIKLKLSGIKIKVSYTYMCKKLFLYYENYKM
jgi:hypothetical protein